MDAASKAVRAELVQMLEADGTRLGEVYRLTQRGLDGPAIAAELGVPTANFVVNNRTIARANLDGKLPSGL
jgi:FAD synthase